jgi:hypothetical protein
MLCAPINVLPMALVNPGLGGAIWTTPRRSEWPRQEVSTLCQPDRAQAPPGGAYAARERR